MLGLGVSVTAHENTFIITFDAPGAGTSAGQGTFAFNIVQGGWISGNYIDADGAYHGFLRAPEGAITKFDVPGEGTGAGQGTVEVKGMTPALEIVGTIQDADNVWHGFLRTPRGKVTTFDAPGAGTGTWQGTQPMTISPEGAITGYYTDKEYVVHGFVRLALP
jgi:hypothetical protein